MENFEMSRQLWDSYQNGARNSAATQDHFCSNTSYQAPCGPIYFNQAPSYAYESQWSSYLSGSKLSVPSARYFSGWQQYCTPADWGSYISTPEYKPSVLQGTQTQDFTPTSAATAASTNVASIKQRKPCARISFVNTANGNYTPVIKRKRSRTAFTTEQIGILEAHYRLRPYVSSDMRHLLSQKLQVSDRVIKVWFQNRRLKEKREKDELSSSSQSPDSVTDSMASTNQFNSCETLNGDAINDMFMSIEQIILDDSSAGSVGEVKAEDENDSSTIIYEPISPSECNQPVDPTFIPVDPLVALENLMLLSAN